MQLVAIYSSSSRAVAFRINAHSGAVIRTDKFRHAITHCQEAGEAGNDERVFILAEVQAPLDRTGRVLVYPASAALPSASPLHLWTADKTTGVLLFAHLTATTHACSCSQFIPVLILV